VKSSQQIDDSLPNGATLLLLSAREGHRAIISYIGAQRPDEYLTPDPDGNLPIHEVMANGYADLARELACLKPETLNVENKMGSRPFHSASFQRGSRCSLREITIYQPQKSTLSSAQKSLSSAGYLPKIWFD